MASLTTPPECSGAFSRRHLLRRSGLGLGALALGHCLTRDGLAGPPRADEALANQNPLVAKHPHFKGTAKNVIFLFMQGGPSHIDTFDPKPDIEKHDGQLLPESFQDLNLAQVNTSDAPLMPSTAKFRRYGKSGMEISDLFKNVGHHADDLALIRSCYHDNVIHGPAITFMHVGTTLLGHPSVGSWVVYGLGCETDSLPSFVAMTDSVFRNGPNMYSSGFLPAVYQGTHVKTEGAPIQNLARPAGLSARDQRRLIDQLQKWNQRHLNTRPGDSRLNARIQNYELAFRMQTAAPDLADISGESKATRELYGIDTESSARFGRMCLLSRRMVERGVRYVHLVNGDWDGHSDCKGNHAKQSAKTDIPISGLLTDLKQRGLLDSTLVVWAGEFGRTPVRQGKDGRDHHPFGFSVWMAGGGIRGGKVIGATDDLGFHAVEDKVHVNDLHSTMLSLLGLDHEKLTYFFEGRDFRLTDVGGHNALTERLLI